MKSSLTLLLLLVTATCVFSGKEISVPTFIDRVLYYPYYLRSGLLTALDKINDKHLLIVAMYPPGVSYRARDGKLVLPFAKHVNSIPVNKLEKDYNGETQYYYGGPESTANPLSIWVANVERSSTVILKDGERMVEQFKEEQDDEDPKIVIIYSYHSPSDEFTQGLIALKKSLKATGGPTFIFSYSVSFEHERTNRAALIEAGFIIYRLPIQNASNNSKSKNKNNSNNSKPKPKSNGKGILQ